jgi:hypothetical protein
MDRFLPFVFSALALPMLVTGTCVPLPHWPGC